MNYRLRNAHRQGELVWHQPRVDRNARERANGHRGAVVWFTGLSAAGKSTLAHATEARLHQIGCRTYVLDGDNIRHGLCADLGFSIADRSENLRRAGEVARLLLDAGMIVLAAFISPSETDRAQLRRHIGGQDFLEVYCRCPIEVCESRDPKGMYRRARAGEIEDFTGVSAVYEPPRAADLVLDTAHAGVETCVDALLALLAQRRIICSGSAPLARPRVEGRSVG